MKKNILTFICLLFTFLVFCGEGRLSPFRYSSNSLDTACSQDDLVTNNKIPKIGMLQATMTKKNSKSIFDRLNFGSLKESVLERDESSIGEELNDSNDEVDWEKVSRREPKRTNSSESLTVHCGLDEDSLNQPANSNPALLIYSDSKNKLNSTTSGTYLYKERQINGISMLWPEQEKQELEQQESLPNVKNYKRSNSARLRQENALSDDGTSWAFKMIRHPYKAALACTCVIAAVLSAGLYWFSK